MRVGYFTDEFRGGFSGHACQFEEVERRYSHEEVGQGIYVTMFGAAPLVIESPNPKI